MNEEIRQILRNQATILNILTELKPPIDLLDHIQTRLDETLKIMNPKKPDPTIKEQTDKSMNRVIKAGQDCPRCGVKEVSAEKLQYHNSGRCLPRSKFGTREK